MCLFVCSVIIVGSLFVVYVLIVVQPVCHLWWMLLFSGLVFAVCGNRGQRCFSVYFKVAASEPICYAAKARLHWKCHCFLEAWSQEPGASQHQAGESTPFQQHLLTIHELSMRKRVMACQASSTYFPTATCVFLHLILTAHRCSEQNRSQAWLAVNVKVP